MTLKTDVDILTDIAVGNDKTFTVPDAVAAPPNGRVWEVLYGRINLTTTATVGNRDLRFQVETAGGVVLFSSDAASTVPASQTDVGHLLGTDPTLPTNRSIWIPGGEIIRVFDTADIDVLDTFAAYIVVRELIEQEI